MASVQQSQVIMKPFGSPPSVPAVRLVQLDFLRGIAILLVLGRHPSFEPANAGRLRGVANLWFNFGWTGVDLFFVLSGFLVGGLLLDEVRKRGHAKVSRFIVRRAFKIWPAYYVLIVGSILRKAVQYNWHTAFVLYWPNLLHVQNYFGGSYLTHTWSLAVEEHFYLALPLLVLVLGSFGRWASKINLLPVIAVFVMASCLILRFVINWNRPFDEFTHTFPTHLRIDGMAFGVVLAYLYHFQEEFLKRISKRRWLLISAGVALVSPIAWFGQERRFTWTIGFTMLYLGYGLILLAFVYTPVDAKGGALSRFFTTRFATSTAWVGLFSYSIYVWHMSFGRHPAVSLMAHLGATAPSGSWGWLISTAVYLICAIGVGFALGKLIEFPALALRDRLFPSFVRAVAAPQKEVTPATLAVGCLGDASGANVLS
jgi:peptidoglycan/LPS O-acetylase OafA/YrhL